MMSWAPASVADHLWQSTLFVALVWLVTLALRRHDARVRYWLWAAASLKFLLPVSWLIGLGALVEWRTAPTIAQPAATFVMQELLAPPLLYDAAVPQVAQDTNIGRSVVLGVWLAGTVVVLFWWARQWRPVRSALRSATPLPLTPGCDADGLKVMSSPSAFEPGVVGILRPVLLMPEGLVDRLTPPQLDAILAHERAHVRAYDNLLAMVHMAVEAIFWFHPLVWWIERRMIDERERACDEAVIRAGKRPADYAEGILTVCRWSQESPVMCVSGVSGSDLRTRIETILAKRLGRRLNVTGRVLLAGAALIVIGGPIGIGLLVAAEQDVPIILSDAPSFDVVSVKPSPPDVRFPGIRPPTNDRFAAIGLTPRMLMQLAYGRDGGLLESQIVSDAKWLNEERFDIVGTSAGLSSGNPFVTIRGLLQTVLRERFNARVHTDTRTLSIYALVLARSDRRLGPGLRPPEAACAKAGSKPSEGVPACGFTTVARGRWSARSLPLTLLASNLAHLPDVGRVVRDQTGLRGTFDMELEFNPQAAGTNAANAAPDIFSALQEQLGLKLESSGGSVEIVVVDHIERPSAN